MAFHTCRPYGVGDCYACDRTAQPEPQATMIHACQYDPRNECEACEAESDAYLDELAEWDDPADREPTPEQEKAWDAREDDLRGHVLADAHAAWLGEDMTPDRP